MQPGMLAVMSLLYGPLVETPLHPGVRAWRRGEIFRIGYADHRRALQQERQQERMYFNGTITVNEMRETFGGG
jgi:hypothetical protein